MTVITVQSGDSIGRWGLVPWVLFVVRGRTVCHRDYITFAQSFSFDPQWFGIGMTVIEMERQIAPQEIKP